MGQTGLEEVTIFGLDVQRLGAVTAYGDYEIKGYKYWDYKDFFFGGGGGMERCMGTLNDSLTWILLVSEMKPGLKGL